MREDDWRRETRETSQTSMDSNQPSVCLCVRGGVVSSGAVQFHPGGQQQPQPTNLIEKNRKNEIRTKSAETRREEE